MDAPTPAPVTQPPPLPLPPRADGRATLSVSIACRNAERTIARTLESVARLADEIVALDSGSTDRTLQILEHHDARILREPWRGYIATKQRAMDACRGDWILCLDADESPDGVLCAAIEGVLRHPTADGYRVNRKVWYLGGYLDHAWQPERRLRLVRAGAARQTGEDPHDRLEMARVAGAAPPRTADLPGTLRHDSFTTIAEHLSRQIEYARISAQGLARRGRRGRYRALLLSPAGAFFKQIVLKGAWRDGPRGWAAAGSTAVAALAKHVILIEMTRCRREEAEEDEGE